MKTETALVFPTLPKDYAGLCRLQMPRPIHGRVEYANVAEVTDKMSLWQDDFTVDQAVGSLPRQPGTIHLRNSGRRGHARSRAKNWFTRLHEPNHQARLAMNLFRSNTSWFSTTR